MMIQVKFIEYLYHNDDVAVVSTVNKNQRIEPISIGCAGEVNNKDVVVFGKDHSISLLELS